MEAKHTKGIFSDGYTGWKIDKRETNGVKGFEIHYSDDGECITDHVYTLEDAKLIASAPEMFEMLKKSAQMLYDCSPNTKDYIKWKTTIQEIEQLLTKITE